MEELEGEGWNCFFAVAGLVGVGVAAVFAPPAGAVLAATMITSGISFAGSVYSIGTGACNTMAVRTDDLPDLNPSVMYKFTR